MTCTCAHDPNQIISGPYFEAGPITTEIVDGVLTMRHATPIQIIPRQRGHAAGCPAAPPPVEYAEWDDEDWSGE